MKNPLKHQSAPVAARTAESSNSREHCHSRNHSHNSAIGHLFQGLTHRLRSDTPNRAQQQTTARNSFHIVHLPDRPVVPILPSDAPSEDECRVLFQELQAGDGFFGQRAISHQETRVSLPSVLPQPVRSTTNAASRPSTRSNASTVRSRTSGTSGTSGTNSSAASGGDNGDSSRVQREPSNSSSRSTQPRRTSGRPPTPIHVNTARFYTNRPLPHIPQSPVYPPSPSQQSPHQPPSRQQTPRQIRPPPPLSARPLLQRRPILPPHELVSFAERVARDQTGQSINLPQPVRVGISNNVHVLPPRQILIDSQTYDETHPSKNGNYQGQTGPLTGADNNMTGQIQGITEPRWQERKPSSPPRPPLPPPLHRSAPSPSQRPLSLPQQSQHKRKNNLPRHPELWVPRISSPLRQAQLSSPYQAHNPEPQNLPSPRPNSADVSPLTPPPQSPARDKALSPERKTLFAVPDTGSQPSIYGTQDPAIVEALLVAEEEKGEPLLEWESETIKSMTGMPSKEQKQMGIVSIGSVSQKCLQPSEAVAAVTTVPTVPAIDYEARAQQALLYENDGSSNDGSSCGDYTTIWPESSYYFSSNPGTAIEKRHRSQPTPTNRSSRSRSNRSSAESNALKRESHASKTTETRQVHFAPPL